MGTRKRNCSFSMVNERDVSESALRGSREPSIKTTGAILRTTSEASTLRSMNSVKIQYTTEYPSTIKQENGYISVAASGTRS